MIESESRPALSRVAVGTLKFNALARLIFGFVLLSPVKQGSLDCGALFASRMLLRDGPCRGIYTGALGRGLHAAPNWIRSFVGFVAQALTPTWPRTLWTAAALRRFAFPQLQAQYSSHPGLASRFSHCPSCFLYVVIPRNEVTRNLLLTSRRFRTYASLSLSTLQLRTATTWHRLSACGL